MSGLDTLLTSIKETEDNYYVIELDGYEIVFCLPSVRQARQYQTLLALSDAEIERDTIYDYIFSGFVHNKDILEDDKLPAGLVESISRTILFYSGVGEYAKPYTKEILAKCRTESDSIINFVKRTICQVFNSYTLESLDLVSYPDLINIFVEAEKVLIERGIIEVPFDIMAEQEKAKPKPFRVEDVIRSDGQAQRDFDIDKATEEDRLNKQRLLKIREDAKSRAIQQERNHMRQHMPRG